MIIIRLAGGLGNQMFQYAFGRTLAKRLNQWLFFDDTLLIEKSETTSDFTARNFELSLFPDIDLRMMSRFYKTILNSKSPIISKVINKIGIIEYINQEENEYLEIERIPLKAISIFNGYFQSQEYFLDYSNFIRSDFGFPELDKRNDLFKDQITNSNSVAIHIRRGDYSTNLSTFQYHGILPIEYFKKSIELLNESQHNLKYFVFTDDVSWALENFKPEYPESIIIEGNEGANCWKDMALMTYSKHHIISNSSFSWWGAWLSTNDGIKIAPKNWFNLGKAKFDIHSIVPESWRIIDC